MFPIVEISGTITIAFKEVETSTKYYEARDKINTCLIPEKLIVKRGGHGDQLSQSIPSLDRFRIEAMMKMIRSNLLSADQRTATVNELKRKCRIYGNGCLKRGNKEEGMK